MTKPNKLAIILSGGGARGAYESGVLSYVFGDLLKKQASGPKVDIISGTSVGAVNSAYLASTVHNFSRGVMQLENMWLELDLNDVMGFGVRQLGGIRRVLVGGGKRPVGLFDTKPLAKLVSQGANWSQLRKNIDSGLLEALTVSATNVHTGRPVVFVDTARPSTGSIAPALPKTVSVRKERIRPEHVMASAAIPIVFPPVAIGSDLHCDGGLRLNTPMSPAIHLGATHLFIVGVSAPNLEPVRRKRLPGASFLLGKVLNAFLIDHLNADLQELERANRLIEFGTQVFGPEYEQKMNRHAATQGVAPRRRLNALAIHPTQDIGTIAADYRKTHKARFGRLFGSTVMRLLDVGGGGDADLASYLLFDGAFAQRLIEVGRADAKRKKDEISAFFESAAKEA